MGARSKVRSVLAGGTPRFGDDGRSLGVLRLGRTPNRLRGAIFRDATHARDHPGLLFFAVLALERIHRRLVTGVFLALLVVGVIYAFAGAMDPWSRVEKLAKSHAPVRFLQQFVIYPWSSYQR